MTPESTHQPEILSPQEQIERFFSRPGEEVIAELATSWVIQEDRSKEFKGSEKTGSTIVVRYPDESAKLYQIESAVLYSDEHTRGKFPKRRAPQIQQMPPGALFGYKSRGPKDNPNIYAFFHTTGAENIGLRMLHEVDYQGNLKTDENAQVTTANTGDLLGLTHEEYTAVSPLQIRGQTGFAVDIANRGYLTPEELTALVEVILSDE